MDKILIICMLCVTFSAIPINCDKLPSYITPCSRNDTNLENCILTEGRKVLKQFSKGNLELQVDPLDPLYLGKLKVSKRRKSGLGIELTDCYFHGLGKADLHNITVDLNGKQNSIKFSTNHSSVRGRYNIDGQILIIPIKGEGNITIKIKYTLCEYLYNFTFYTDDKGLQHGNITTDDLQCDIGKSTFKLDNLFGGNKELGILLAAFAQHLQVKNRLFAELHTPYDTPHDPDKPLVLDIVPDNDRTKKNKNYRSSSNNLNGLMKAARESDWFDDIVIALQNVYSISYGDNINNIINTSFYEELMNDMGPPVLDAIRRGVKGRINDFYARVSMDDIFPMEQIVADE